MKNRNVWIPMVLMVAMLVAFATSCDSTPSRAVDDELFVEFSTSLPIAASIFSLESSIEEKLGGCYLGADSDFHLSMLLLYSNVANPFGMEFDETGAELKKTVITDGRPKDLSESTSTITYEVQLDVSVPYSILASTEESAAESATDTDAEKQKLVVSGKIFTKEIMAGEGFKSLEMKISNMSLNGVTYKDISFVVEGDVLTDAKVDGKEVSNKQALLPLIIQFMQRGE